MNIFLYISILGVVGFCLAVQFVCVRNSIRSIKWTGCALCLSSAAYGGYWILSPQTEFSTGFGFVIDPLSSLMILLILLVSGIVHLFSLRYMAGDRNYRSFFLKLTLLTASVLGFAASDDIFLLEAFWIVNQILLSGLMTHKSEWRQAKKGGRLFLKWALAGSVFLALGLMILSLESGSFSIREICLKSGQMDGVSKLGSFLFILTGALIQSGIWPFHRWLISSLNSPTPVSAFMHAGLVNGGGILLARLAPLILKDEIFLLILIVLGGISLSLGTVWKLIQPNIKKMLACSTMAQMGFMFLQCGLGLFPAAVAHIFLHGLFKGFLFLNSGSAIESKNILEKVEKPGACIYSFFSCGIGAIAFYFASGMSLEPFNSQIVILFFSAIAGFHMSLTALRRSGPIGILLAPLSTLLFGFFYGIWIHFFEFILEPMGFWVPQPLEIIHLGSIGCFFVIAIAINYLSGRYQDTSLWKRMYVKMLNASQSDCKTITSIRSEYQF